jgi:hypothetical protein
VSDLGEAIDEIRAAYAEAMPDFMPDVCTVSVPGGVTNAGDGTWGTGATSNTADVPCKYEPLNAFERAQAGRVAAFADHRLTLPAVWQGAALIVPPDATVTVAARGVNPQRVFTVTGPLYSSSDLTLAVAAKLEG